MKRLFIAFITFTLMQFSAFADETNPYDLVKLVNEQTFARFNAEKSQVEQDVEHLRLIIEEELLPHIDYKYAAYKVIGKNIKKTTREQRDRFVIAFRDYLVQTYSQILGQYDDQTLSFEPGKDYKGKKVVAARMSILDGARPPIKIVFKLRKSKKTKKWKAFDMIAEGISLLSSKQSELGPLIRKQGIDSVTEQLIKKSSAPLVIDKRF